MAGSREPRIYRETDHTADLRVEIYGTSREELFHHAILTLYTLLGFPRMAASPQRSDDRSSGGQVLTFCGTDEADLLVQLLGELLSVAVTERRCWVPREGGCRVTRDRDTAFLRLEGDWRDLLPIETGLEREIKAVTYHDAAIRKHGDGYVATVVMDL